MIPVSPLGALYIGLIVDRWNRLQNTVLKISLKQLLLSKDLSILVEAKVRVKIHEIIDQSYNHEDDWKNIEKTLGDVAVMISGDSFDAPDWQAGLLPEQQAIFEEAMEEAINDVIAYLFSSFNLGYLEKLQMPSFGYQHRIKPAT